MNFVDLMGNSEAPYQLSLELEKGSKFKAKPPYPDVEVLHNESVHIREFKWQRLVTRVSTPETGKVEEIQVMRLVAIMEGDVEIEIQRIAMPADVEEDVPVDITTCAGCGGSIPFGQAEEYEGKAYHRGRCIR